MRRDHFTATVQEAAEKPTLSLSYDGPVGELTSQLTDEQSALFAADEVDAAFRLQAPLDDSPTGVFSLTHRLTGEFLLEVNADTNELFSLVDAARDRADNDDSTRYRVRIEREGDGDISYDLDALFVYDSDGELLRKQSLIPSGVEL